ncbi:DUF3298 and DUF4163 domain-containing protein, partial [Xanthomonas sp. Kuri4-2]
SAAAPAAESGGPLKDVMEHTPAYVVGISYPPGLERYPGLARQVGDYAASARAELMEAVDGLGNDKPPAPYELSLSFEIVLDTPALVAVAADGSRYTGGAHGEPLVARFVWLPQAQPPLTAAALVPGAQGWAEIGRYVGAQLHAAAEARAAADRLDPQEQHSRVDSADKMIAEGTAAKAENFAQFQPLVNAAGKITRVRFVFPPYQVGPYSDGTQTAEVPASVLLPWVAPAYAELFAR